MEDLAVEDLAVEDLAVEDLAVEDLAVEVPGGGGLGRGGLDSGGFGGSGLGGGGLAGQRGSGGLGGGLSRNSFGDRSSGGPPSRNQLSSFLGLPSDGGMHNLSSTNINNVNRNTNINANVDVNRSANVNNFGGRTADDNFDVNRGAVVGPRGGAAAGGSITGPGGNTAYRGAAVGPNGGVAAGRGVDGAGGGSARQGFAAGPDGRAVAGGAVRGPNGGVAARGVAVGPRGYAAGFARVSPSGRYASATVVRGSFHSYNLYRPGWYTDHPGAWFAAGWTAGRAWDYATWNTMQPWFGYYAAQPIYYDYGNNVTYQDSSVYINGQDAGTSQEYYEQAEQLATAGSKADAPSDGDWLPLGVFAMSPSGKQDSNMVIQLAVNKTGIIRGNFTDTQTNTTEMVQGSVDKETQRAAWSIGSDSSKVVETGLYNLTKEEAPCLVHLGAEQTQQWLLVRLKQDQQQGQQQDQGNQ